MSKKGFRKAGFPLYCLAIAALLAACSTGTDAVSSSTSAEESLSTSLSDNSSEQIVSSSETQSTPSGEYLKETLVGEDHEMNNWEKANGKFYADFNTQAELREAGSELNKAIAGEGFVLLKNENEALPLAKDENHVSLFGYKSYALQYGGGGSGAGQQGVYGIPVSTLLTSLEENGFKYNTKLQETYTGVSSELNPDEFGPSITSTYKTYGDVAILTFARTGAEGSDEKMFDVAGNADKEKHYLELTDNEILTVKHAKANFKKVIVLVNSANCIELGELNEKKTEDNLGVDAILWIGQTGNDGAAAIAKILNGTINPSGHTVDTWEKDFTKGPSYTNIGSLAQNKLADGTRDNNNLYVGSEIAKNSVGQTYHAVEYRENIYVGYKYYETAYDTAAADKKEEAYSNVVYPFGYGLSYTSFDWELASDVAPKATVNAKNETVTIKVKVTNTGKVAGKDVVQVYVNPPYTAGGIEKATANLVGFAKTKLLAPGESQVVTVQFVAQDMASFDYNDKNDNDFYGYELEAGKYVISARRNSHDVALTVEREVKEGIKCETDIKTGKAITPKFTGDEGLERYKSTNDTLEENEISRTDLKQPKAATREDRTVDASYIQFLESEREYFSCQDTKSDPWYVNAVPENWDQEVGERVNGKTPVQLKDMIGKRYDERQIVNGSLTGGTSQDSKAWDDFMNQLSWEEMVGCVSAGDYGQGFNIPAIGKDKVYGGDGPTQFGWNTHLFFGSAGFKQYDTTGLNWVVAPIVAASWNTELAARQGEIVGNESLFSNVTEWYGPAANTHRSPFSGRNFEYYSEDGLIAGKMLASVVKGCSSKGVIARMKHMFLNDQETNRNTSGGVLEWCNEQAIREIYLKPYEIAVKEGHATGGMTAFNRIGDAVCSTNYALLEGIFRGEWEFKGTFVTDCQDYAEYRYLNLMCRTGQELPLGQTINLYNGEKIYEGRFGIGYASAVEGTWSKDDKCVKVAANIQDASEVEKLRRSQKDMADLYHKEEVVTAAAAKETILSPTQYYAVRKSAQRVLYQYVNSNAVKNGLNKSFETQTFNLQKGKKASGSIALDAAVIGTKDIKIVSTSTLPAGLAISNKGAFSGTVTADAGDYNVTVSLLLDGWVKATLPLVITIA